jgi:hypothetical protein
LLRIEFVEEVGHARSSIACLGFYRKGREGEKNQNLTTETRRHGGKLLAADSRWSGVQPEHSSCSGDVAVLRLYPLDFRVASIAVIPSLASATKLCVEVTASA